MTALGGSLACPFFMPTHVCSEPLWPHPQRLPLGAGYFGYCTADGNTSPEPGTRELRAPDARQLKDCCNMGYARSCARLPQDRTADANRFFVARAGNELIVTYCSERDHAPAGNGVLHFDPVVKQWAERHPNVCLQRQAECAVESFLRRCASNAAAATAARDSHSHEAAAAK